MNITNFKGSYQWLIDFKKRNKISFRKINSLSATDIEWDIKKLVKYFDELEERNKNLHMIKYITMMKRDLNGNSNHNLLMISKV